MIAWQNTPPPKDRSIVIIGKVMNQDEISVWADPVCGSIHWKEESKMWVDSDGMAVRRYLESYLIIHYWSDLPWEELKPNVEIAEGKPFKNLTEKAEPAIIS